MIHGQTIDHFESLPCEIVEFEFAPSAKEQRAQLYKTTVRLIFIKL